MYYDTKLASEVYIKYKTYICGGGIASILFIVKPALYCTGLARFDLTILSITGTSKL